jgi:hypothetical protein
VTSAFAGLGVMFGVVVGVAAVATLLAHRSRGRRAGCAVPASTEPVALEADLVGGLGACHDPRRAELARTVRVRPAWSGLSYSMAAFVPPRWSSFGVVKAGMPIVTVSRQGQARASGGQTPLEK